MSRSPKICEHMWPTLSPGTRIFPLIPTVGWTFCVRLATLCKRIRFLQVMMWFHRQKKILFVQFSVSAESWQHLIRHWWGTSCEADDNWRKTSWSVSVIMPGDPLPLFPICTITAFFVVFDWGHLHAACGKERIVCWRFRELTHAKLDLKVFFWFLKALPFFLFWLES